MAIEFSVEKHYSFLAELKADTQYGVSPDITSIQRVCLRKSTSVQSLVNLRLRQSEEIRSTKATKAAFTAYLNTALEKRNSRDFYDKLLWGASLEREENSRPTVHLDALLSSLFPLTEIKDPSSQEDAINDIEVFLTALPSYLSLLSSEKQEIARGLEHTFRELQKQFKHGDFDRAKVTLHQIVLLIHPQD